MHPVLRDIQAVGLSRWCASRGVTLPDDHTDLRDVQVQALDWALGRPEPYLLLSAPTGSGKTLINVVYGLATSPKWTYGVHTIALQEQVQATTGLPVVKGRRHFACTRAEEERWLSAPLTAGEAPCLDNDYECSFRDEVNPCPYFRQLHLARRADRKIANYAHLLSLPGPWFQAPLLLADEGHRIEEIVADHGGLALNRGMWRRHGVVLPRLSRLDEWAAWARTEKRAMPRIQRPGGKADLSAVHVRRGMAFLRSLAAADVGDWLVEDLESGPRFRPIWGRTVLASSPLSKFRRWFVTSATLMGAEYVADRLGLVANTWAYLDLSSTFPVAHRPVIYRPVVGLNYEAMTGDSETRATMQTAIDGLLAQHFARGDRAGLIHGVSNRYRDYILAESSYAVVMTPDRDAHVARIGRGELSVLVSANTLEGWDGHDELCRFVIFPKVPFPDLSDQRVRLRKDGDPRSYDYEALVAVVQGAGRGVRHELDTCATYILDWNWRQLFTKRRDWLPAWFLEAYRRED